MSTGDGEEQGPSTAEPPDQTQKASKPQRELGSLNFTEIWWRDRQPMLESHGYMLRPRFRPGWVPSWHTTKKTKLEMMLSEDFHLNHHHKTMDATRKSDGSVVLLKRVATRSQEAAIAEFLTTPEKLNDPRNHTVRILDQFVDDTDPEISYIVMPLLRSHNRPPFSSVDEVLDFIQQTLDGLSFIHSQGVAHRDLAGLNIMMDGGKLYPKGFHPGSRNLDASGTTIANPRRRRDVGGVKYYITDFGVSTKFDDDGSPRLVTGTFAADRHIPELSNTVPYDPFLVDVLTLGNVYKRVIEGYINLSFLTPLTDAMTDLEPSQRPTVDEALVQFGDIVRQQPGYRLRWNLKDVDETRTIHLFDDVSSIGRECVYQLLRIISEA